MPAGAGTATAVKDPTAALAKTHAALEKKLGKGSIHKASESVPVNHLPFLEPNLNYATMGGAPFGRFAALYGDESTGKTRVAYELIAQLHDLPRSAEVVLEPRIAYHTAFADDTNLDDKIRSRHAEVVVRLIEELDWIRRTFPDGAEAVYYNAEQQFDSIYAAKIGIDLDRLLIVESTTIEDIGSALEAYYGHYAMHVVDSTSSASSLLSQKQDPGKSLMGTDARVWKTVIRDSLAVGGWDIERNLGVLIHQMSTNIKTGGAQAASTRYLRHTSSCSIKFTRGKFLWNRDGVLKEDKAEGADEASMAGIAEPDGIEVYAKIEKSRTCRPFRVGGLQFDFKKLHFTTMHDLANAGLYFAAKGVPGMINKSGSWYKVDGEDENIGQGLKTVYTRLSDDEELRQRITNRLLDFTDED